MAQKQPKPEAKPSAPIPKVERYGPPSTNPLAVTLAAKWKAKQMLARNPLGGIPLPDETGERPAPSFSLSKFDPNILGGSRRNYEKWRLDQRYAGSDFAGKRVSGLPSA